MALSMTPDLDISQGFDSTESSSGYDLDMAKIMDITTADPLRRSRDTPHCDQCLVHDWP